MGATAAVEILHRRELAAEPDPDRRADLVAALAARHEATTGGLARALECGVIDGIITPADTRRVLVEALASSRGGRGERANGPL
jgi:acetyl-CoA/propionyl-CoA carboxylase carboxyl transferase subunit